MTVGDHHICELPVRARNGKLWRCSVCNQCWRLVDGRWRMTIAEVEPQEYQR